MIDKTIAPSYKGKYRKKPLKRVVFNVTRPKYEWRGRHQIRR